MNGIAASMLLNMTSSVRFDGSLNVDLNDITMNLVPFPHVRPDWNIKAYSDHSDNELHFSSPHNVSLMVQMHFLISSMSPLSSPKDLAKLSAPRTLDQVCGCIMSTG